MCFLPRQSTGLVVLPQRSILKHFLSRNQCLPSTNACSQTTHKEPFTAICTYITVGIFTNCVDQNCLDKADSNHSNKVIDTSRFTWAITRVLSIFILVVYSPHPGVPRVLQTGCPDPGIFRMCFLYYIDNTLPEQGNYILKIVMCKPLETTSLPWLRVICSDYLWTGQSASIVVLYDVLILHGRPISIQHLLFFGIHKILIPFQIR